MSYRFSVSATLMTALLPLCAIATILQSTPASAGLQTQNPDAKPLTSQTAPTNAATQKPASASSAKPATGKANAQPFKDVPFDSPLYAAVNDLQMQGVVKDYPEGYFRGRRPLTYYEFGLAAVRTVKGWDVLTLAPDGITMQTMVAVPRNLTLDQAHRLLKVWTETRVGVGASDFGAAKTDLIIRTLRAYVNLLTTNNPAKPAAPANAKPDLPKEQK